ncbi:hypothetical protein EMCRGX_G026281 [Ephydatia muelleri]
MSQLKKFVVSHIPHIYSEKMADKSEVIVLDVLHKNEIKSTDMIQMREMASYLGATYKHIVLTGGDHVTCEREQRAKRHVMCSNAPEGRLEQLEPCVEDWHCVMNFMMLICFQTSQRDYCSLFQLFTRLGRLPKARKPKDDMRACQDALLIVFKGHILAAACTELGIEGPNDDINGVEINQTLLKDVTLKVAKRLAVISEPFLNESVPDTGDGVHNYARVLCHFAALVYLFIDAWKEGDGERVIRLQFQLVTLQPYLVHQLMWGRFVNTHGGKGRNIPCDLQNEHVNKLYKDIVANMGANFTEVASIRAARAVLSLERLALAFDKHTGIHPEATAHSTREDE